MRRPQGTGHNGLRRVRLTVLMFLALGLGCPVLWGGGNESYAKRACGIEIRSVRLTAGGGFLDLRFRVLDPQGGPSPLNPSVPVSVVHQPTGRALSVASSKIGKLRQRTAQPELGKEYFILFRNSAGLVRPGDNITLVAGNCKVEDLEVQ